jgi:hypothetical protein
MDILEDANTRVSFQKLEVISPLEMLVLVNVGTGPSHVKIDLGTTLSEPYKLAIHISDNHVGK